MPKVTLYVPDALMEKIQEEKADMNLSEVFQEAVQDELARRTRVQSHQPDNFEQAIQKLRESLELQDAQLKEDLYRIVYEYVIKGELSYADIAEIHASGVKGVIQLLGEKFPSLGDDVFDLWVPGDAEGRTISECLSDGSAEDVLYTTIAEGVSDAASKLVEVLRDRSASLYGHDSSESGGQVAKPRGDGEGGRESDDSESRESSNDEEERG